MNGPDHVVGIGASAGGIPALKLLLSRFRPDSAAFVVLMHLPPDRTSLLGAVLRSSTSMAVEPIQATTRMRENRIYVLPEGADLTISGNLLALEPQPATRPRWTINRFFEALARARQDKAVGVVLSGAGSDGTKGLAAIRAGGGLTFVQSPESAEFSAMPNSARAVAQFCLPPAELGDQLMRSLGVTTVSTRISPLG